MREYVWKYAFSERTRKRRSPRIAPVICPVPNTVRKRLCRLFRCRRRGFFRFCADQAPQFIVLAWHFCLSERISKRPSLDKTKNNDHPLIRQKRPPRQMPQGRIGIHTECRRRHRDGRMHSAAAPAHLPRGAFRFFAEVFMPPCGTA